jgi:hypothetical protein
MRSPVQKYMIPLLLIVWFWVWGICPWNEASGADQASETAPVGHGHHEVDDTHHASKGTEHSCSGSVSYQNKSQNEQPHEAGIFLQNGSLPDPIIRLIQHHGILKPLLQRSTLPKLLTEYYQLYSVYRI